MEHPWEGGYVPNKLVLLMYESWAQLDRSMSGLNPEETITRYDGGSSVAWTLGHVTNMVDSWINSSTRPK